MTNVLITGGAGFIGSHLARRCLARGDHVHITARPQTDLRRLADMRAELRVHVLELADRDALARCLAQARPHEVYHLAARTRWPQIAGLADAEASISTDLVNLVAVLAAASAADAAPQVLVRAGSLAEYGDGPAPYVETQREKPLNTYAAAMTACTHYSQMLQPRLPFAAVTARLALCYGPDQNEDFLIPALIRNGLAGRPTRLERPDDRRDLVFVDDAVDALCRLAGAQLPGGTIVNVATGIAPTMRQVAQMVMHAVGADPRLIEAVDGPQSPDAIADLRASPALARDLLDWQAQTTLAEGIGRLASLAGAGKTAVGVEK